MYRLHLAAAYGFYNHMLIRFQSEFGAIVNLDGFLNFPILSHEKSGKRTINILFNLTRL
jgi:hypothetical protein